MSGPDVDDEGDMRAQDAVTLRDAFAMAALPALLALCNNDAREEGLSYQEHIAAVSYGVADAMLKARQKPSEASPSAPVTARLLQAWALALSQGAPGEVRYDIERVLQLWGHPTRAPE